VNNPLDYKNLALGKIKAVNEILLAKSHIEKGSFAGVTMSDLIGAKAAVSKAVESAKLVGDLSYYYIFDAGDFNLVIDKYTGDYFFARGGDIMTLEEGDLTRLIK
jgi:hypothetical protein